MPRYVTPAGVEIELSEAAASRVGYKPKGEAQPKPPRQQARQTPPAEK